MKKFDVEITETLQRTVSVEAASQEEAERMVTESWNNDDYTDRPPTWNEHGTLFHRTPDFADSVQSSGFDFCCRLLGGRKSHQPCQPCHCIALLNNDGIFRSEPWCRKLSPTVPQRMADSVERGSHHIICWNPRYNFLQPAPRTLHTRYRSSCVCNALHPYRSSVHMDVCDHERHHVLCQWHWRDQVSDHRKSFHPVGCTDTGRISAFTAWLWRLCNGQCTAEFSGWYDPDAVLFSYKAMGQTLRPCKK